jgi:hypothetical protein
MNERVGRHRAGHEKPTVVLAESVRLSRLLAGSIVP